MGEMVNKLLVNFLAYSTCMGDGGNMGESTQLIHAWGKGH